MSVMCSRPGCRATAAGQLSYDYASSLVEVSPVDPEPDPNVYPLCQDHLDRLKVPKGWRLVTQGTGRASHMTTAQVDALAQRIRAAGSVRAEGSDGAEQTLSGRKNLVTLTRRAHLRLVADAPRHDTGLARTGTDD